MYMCACACVCVCSGGIEVEGGISSGDLHHPGHLKTACSMSLVIIQASLFSSCNISRIVIPGHLPAFTSLKFLLGSHLTKHYASS